MVSTLGGVSILFLKTHLHQNFLRVQVLFGEVAPLLCSACQSLSRLCIFFQAWNNLESAWDQLADSPHLQSWPLPKFLGFTWDTEISVPYHLMLGVRRNCSCNLPPSSPTPPIISSWMKDWQVHTTCKAVQGKTTWGNGFKPDSFLKSQFFLPSKGICISMVIP